jgi:5-formyltetrahydrofolate cyclo-ligase
MPKKSIRSELLARRRHLSLETCLTLSLRIQERFLSSAEFENAVGLAIYSPVWSEVFTEEIFRAARRAGKRTAYPRVHEQSLEFIEVTDLRELVPGRFGIPEPAKAPAVPLAELDLVVVPGVAFDSTGHRLGYGAGFYDRVLHGCENRGLLAGLCFEFQVLDKLPAEDHDVRMDMVVSEESTYRFDHRDSRSTNKQMRRSLF